jgi:hypothetical protein
MTLTAQEEALIGVVRQLPPDEGSKVLRWAQQLREIAGSGPVQWSDSWTEEDLADARRSSMDRVVSETEFSIFLMSKNSGSNKHPWMSLTSALLPLLGIAVGAVLQFFFTRYLEAKKHHRDERAKANADYLRCVSEQANLSPNPNSSEHKQLLYGAQAVVASFAEFERLDASMRTQEQRSAFTQMVQSMRKDAIGSAATEADLEVLLLGARAVK